MTRARTTSIAQLMESQSGLATHGQLANLDLPRSTRCDRVGSGRWIQVLPNVVCPLPWSALGYDARLKAGLLSLGAGSCVAGVTNACLLRGWRGAPPRRPQFLTTRDLRDRSPVLDVRSTSVLADVDVRQFGPLDIASPARTTADLGRYLTCWQIANVVHELAFHHGMTAADVEHVLDRVGRQRGVGVVRAAVQLYLDGNLGTKSFTEDAFLSNVLRAGRRIDWVNREVPVSGGSEEVDFHWPSVGLCIEVDGSTGHARPGIKAKDRSKSERLRAAGYRLIRLTGSQGYRPPAAVLELIPRA